MLTLCLVLWKHTHTHTHTHTHVSCHICHFHVELHIWGWLQSELPGTKFWSLHCSFLWGFVALWLLIELCEQSRAHEGSFTGEKHTSQQNRKRLDWQIHKEEGKNNTYDPNLALRLLFRLQGGEWKIVLFFLVFLLRGGCVWMAGLVSTSWGGVISLSLHLFYDCMAF